MKKLVALVLAVGILSLSSAPVSAYCPPHYFYSHTVVSGYTSSYNHQYILGYMQDGSIVWGNCHVTQYHDIWMYSCSICGAIYEGGGQYDEIVREEHSSYHP